MLDRVVLTKSPTVSCYERNWSSNRQHHPVRLHLQKSAAEILHRNWHRTCNRKAHHPRSYTTHNSRVEPESIIWIHATRQTVQGNPHKPKEEHYKTNQARTTAKRATTHGDFTHKTGLVAKCDSQDSPLSPTLFNIYMDTLGACMK